MIEQESERNCVSACLRMVLGFYGRSVANEEVETFIAKDEQGSSFEIEAARFAARQGLRVDCFAYNLVLTDPRRDGGLPAALLLERLKDRRRRVTEAWSATLLDLTIGALREGVHYVIRRPSLATIRTHLDRGIPLIVTVNPAALYQHMGDARAGHAVVLTGMGERTISFVDPGLGAEQELPIEDVWFGLVARKLTVLSAYMIAIRPPQLLATP